MDIFYLNFSLEITEISEIETIRSKRFLTLTEREVETVLSLGNGYIGTRNSLEELYPESDPGSFVAGLYVQAPDDPYNFLVKIPDWTSIKIFVEDEQLNLNDQDILSHTRYIDLANGTVVRNWKSKDPEGRETSVKIIKYISLFDKHELGKMLIIKPENYSGNIKVTTGIDANTAAFKYLLNQNCAFSDYASIYMKTKYTNKHLAMMQQSRFLPVNSGDLSLNEYKVENYYDGSFETFDWKADMGEIYAIKSFNTIYISNSDRYVLESAQNKIINLGGRFKDSYINHSKKWNERWNDSRINLSGNPDDQRLLDFAAYHLIISGEFSGINHSIPARDLSGESYKGHVFWDTEMYLLPYFTYTAPEIARNLLIYRYNTLDGARQNAVNEGFKGASYAWESTDSGLEMTPEFVILPNGEVVNILSGNYENHISADIAYAIWRYWQATDDNDFITNYGAEILFETARFAESQLVLEDDGLYHIPEVIGPDEYHEVISDNAYTNYLINTNFELAVWGYEFLREKHPDKFEELRQKLNIQDDEFQNWKKYSERMYLGFDHNNKLFEQFRGYFDYEFIDLGEYEPRSAPMDIILGREKTQNSQVIKQADVLMFLYLLGEQFPLEIVEKNYHFYEPRTSHGSSLSPSIHSIIASRIGKKEEAYRYFLKNAKIDIGDEFGNASGGIHIAAIGGVWLSVVMGFAGMHPCERGLIFNPNMPDEWESFDFKIKWKGQCLNIKIDRDSISFKLTGDKSIWVSAGFDNWSELGPGNEFSAFREDNKWRWKE